MLSELQKDSLIESLVNGVAEVTIDTIYRYKEDIGMTKDFTAVAFFPTNERFAMGTDNWLSKHPDNPLYNLYGYGEFEIVRVITALEDNESRSICFTRIRKIEKYIRNNWDILINNGSVRSHSFTMPKLLVFDHETKMYGYEMTFKVLTSHTWTDMPDDIEYIRVPHYIEDIHVLQVEVENNNE